MAKRQVHFETSEVNMTPMIDVVFQLIIFFVVTLKMSKEFNKEIILEDSKNGETITQENSPVQTLTIEVARRTLLNPRGRVSINNATLSTDQLKNILLARQKKFGSFPVLIRADYRALHEDVKRVMDTCTAVGCWKVGFVAVQEHKNTKGRHQGE